MGQEVLANIEKMQLLGNKYFILKLDLFGQEVLANIDKMQLLGNKYFILQSCSFQFSVQLFRFILLNMANKLHFFITLQLYYEYFIPVHVKTVTLR